MTEETVEPLDALRCEVCLQPWEAPVDETCQVCGKRICRICIPRAHRCGECGLLRCVVCEAKSPHRCPNEAAKIQRNLDALKLPDPGEFEDIRILPMPVPGQFQGGSLEDVQRGYFLGEVVDRGGMIRYRRLGLHKKDGHLLVLFQMLGRIVGSAKLLEVTDSTVPELVDEVEYKGRYWFDPKTIRMVESIGIEAFRQAVPEIQGFSQARQTVPMKRLDAVLALLASRTPIERG